MSGKIEGKIASVSEEGDLITDIPFSQWTNLPRESHVRIIVDDEHETFGIHGMDHRQPTMTLIALVEEPHPLRLHLVGDSASMMLGVRAGAPVRVEW